MIRKIVSFLSVMALAIIILPSVSMDARAEMLQGYPQESALIDELGLYDDDKETFNELDAKIKEEAEKLDLNLIVFLSGNYRYETAVEIFADDSYDEIFGENTDGIFYYLDLSGGSPANDWISTSGRAVLDYEKSIESISSTLDHYLPSSDSTIYPEDITEAIQAYLNCLERYRDDKHSVFEYHYDEGNAEHPYTYYDLNGNIQTSKKKPIGVYVMPFIASVIIGLITSLIIFFHTMSKYRSREKVDSRIYISNNLTRFTRSENIFIRTDTRKTRIDSGGGSGGGHRSGGGGSHHSHSGHHGGGGHHR